MKRTYCIPVYHVNSPEIIKKILNSYKNNSGRLYNTLDDQFWAGKGMYFWDNVGNAEYWKKIRKNHNMSESKILSADLKIEGDCILDLTDRSILHTYNKLWPKIANEFKVRENTSPGFKIDIICKFLLEFNKNIKIVKVCGYYPKLKEHSFFKCGNIDKNKPHVTSKARIIFCVKSDDGIENVHMIKD